MRTPIEARDDNSFPDQAVEQLRAIEKLQEFLEGTGATLAQRGVLILATLTILTSSLGLPASTASAEGNQIPIAVELQQQACGQWHTVQAGDTVYALARRYEFSITTFLINNPTISNPNAIRIGQTLCVSKQELNVLPTPVRTQQNVPATPTPRIPDSQPAAPRAPAAPNQPVERAPAAPAATPTPALRVIPVATQPAQATETTCRTYAVRRDLRAPGGLNCLGYSVTHLKEHNPFRGEQVTTDLRQFRCSTNYVYHIFGRVKSNGDLQSCQGNITFSASGYNWTPQ